MNQAIKNLIEDAALADELFDSDELEEFAAKLKLAGKTPQLAPGDSTDLTGLAGK